MHLNIIAGGMDILISNGHVIQQGASPAVVEAAREAYETIKQIIEREKNGRD